MAKWDLSKLPEGRKPLPDEWFREKAQMQERIAGLEAKLTKAVEALEKVQAFVSDLEPYADQGHTMAPAFYDACTTLAELKGEK